MPCSSCHVNGHYANTCNLNPVKKVVDKFNKYIDDGEPYTTDNVEYKLIGKAIIQYLNIIYIHYPVSLYHTLLWLVNQNHHL